MHTKISALGAKKFLMFLCMSIFFVSCGQNTAINETQTSNTQELTAQTSQESEVEIQDSEITQTENILLTSSIIPLSSVMNTVG